MGPSRTPAILSPGASSHAAYAPGREERLPDIDDRLVAPDVSVFGAGIDPATKGRYLEEVVFEVHDTERIKHATEKAEALVQRGVRRLFCIRVHTRTVFEWARKDDDWIELDPGSDITDVCFRVPIPVGALIDRVLADDTIARALLASHNRVIQRALQDERAQSREQGVTQERRASLKTVCELLRIELTDARNTAIERADGDTLARRIDHLKRTREWPQDAR